MSALIQEAARLLVPEKIRASGDRGTSVLNYITNLVAFLSAMYSLCLERGWSSKAAKKMVTDFSAGDLDTHDMFGEGDDGEHFFSSLLMLMLSFTAKNKVNTPDTAAFGEAFFKQYAKLGLTIEPQGAAGEVPFSQAA